MGDPSSRSEELTARRAAYGSVLPRAGQQWAFPGNNVNWDPMVEFTLKETCWEDVMKARTQEEH